MGEIPAPVNLRSGNRNFPSPDLQKKLRDGFDLKEVYLVADAAERKTTSTYDVGGGAPGYTKAVQTDVPGILWILLADDVTLDASWMGLPFTQLVSGDMDAALKAAGLDVSSDPAIAFQRGTDEITVLEEPRVHVDFDGGWAVTVTSSAYSVAATIARLNTLSNSKDAYAAGQDLVTTQLLDDGTSAKVFWTGTRWEIHIRDSVSGDYIAGWYSAEDVATPDLVSVWTDDLTTYPAMTPGSLDSIVLVTAGSPSVQVPAAWLDGTELTVVAEDTGAATLTLAAEDASFTIEGAASVSIAEGYRKDWRRTDDPTEANPDYNLVFVDSAYTTDSDGGPPDKYNGTVAPTANDDSADTGGNGVFAVGSVWVDVTADVAYVCVDATPTAAVWLSGKAVPGGVLTFSAGNSIDGTTGLALATTGNLTLTATGAPIAIVSDTDDVNITSSGGDVNITGDTQVTIGADDIIINTTGSINMNADVDTAGNNILMGNGNVRFNDAGSIYLGTGLDARLQWNNASSRLDITAAIIRPAGNFVMPTGFTHQVEGALNFTGTGLGTGVQFGSSRYIIKTGTALTVANSDTTASAGQLYLLGHEDVLIQSNTASIALFASSLVGYTLVTVDFNTVTTLDLSSLPTGAGAAPGGVSAGEIWVDTSADNALKQA